MWCTSQRQLTGFAAVHGEAALLTHEGFAQARPFAEHLAGVGEGARDVVAGGGGRLAHRLHHQRGRLTGVGHVHQTGP